MERRSIAFSPPDITELEIQEVAEALRSGWITTGPRTKKLEKELAEYAAAEQHRQNTASRLDNIFTILDGMKNHPLTYDDAVIRQILQCVIVESKEKIKVVFIGGMEVKTEVEQ